MREQTVRVRVLVVLSIAAWGGGCASPLDDVAPMRAALGEDAGADAAAAASPHVCTRMPLGWLARCGEPRFHAHPLCAALSDALGSADDARAEIVALQLNIEASDDGMDPAGLGELRFHAGARRRQTLREWATEGAERSGRRADVTEAARVAFDANRSFLACVPVPVPPDQDQGVAICGDPSQRAVGPKGAACAALDSECGRGEFDGATGCCRVTPRPPGVPCSLGVCNDSGACVAPRRPAAARSRAPRDGFVGYAHWVESFGREVFLWATDVGLEIRLDGTTAVELTRTVPPIDLSEVHVKTQGPQAQYGAVLVGAPAGVRTLFVPRIAQSAQASLVTGAVDALGRVASDGSSQGTVTLDCPGSSGPFSCAVDEQFLRVSGPEVSLAWERWLPPGGVPDDVHTTLLPTCLLPGLCSLRGIGSCTPACRIGSSRACGCPTSRAGGTFARCEANGCWGRCEYPPEVCNGFDDDCDGVIDEGGNVSCSDRTSCTFDRCVSGRCQNLPLDALCNDSAACTLEACLAAPPVEDSRDFLHYGPSLNGCFYVDRNSYCTDAWDACECNGTETCHPAGQSLTALASTDGCVPGALRDYPCELHTTGEDRSDGNACTTELCVEPIARRSGLPACRLIRADVDLCESVFDLGACARVLLYDNFVSSAQDPIVGGTRVDTPGGPVWCWTDGAVAPAPSICDDHFPCTEDSCIDPLEGLCAHPPLHAGATPGATPTTPACDGIEDRGCTQWQCDGSGNCEPEAHTPDPDDPAQNCSGQASLPEPGASGLEFPTCAEWRCQDRDPASNRQECVALPNGLSPYVRCDDGAYCNGREICVVTGDDALPGPAGTLHGCVRPPGPCDDGVACTTDACDEGTDVCGSNAPVNAACPGGQHACSPDSICDPVLGCTAPPSGFNPCDDGNPLTDDLCTCAPADEFCRTSVCTHSFHPREM